MRGRRGAAEEHGWVRAVDRRIQHLRTLNLQVLAIEIEVVVLVRPGQHLAPDTDKFGRLLIAFRVVEELAVTGQLCRVTAGHEVHQQPTAG